jgi:hypothetical protein
MKKLLLSAAFFTSIGLNAQTTIFEDSFDTYADFAITNVGAWTLIDVDLKTTYGFSGITFANSGAAKSFQVFNATTTVAPLDPTATSNWTARTGNKHMVCFAADAPAPALNNDWMISPLVTLGTSGNVLTFWAKSCDTAYGLEKFKVGISAGNTTANVTLLSTGNFITTPSTAVWAQYTYSVPAAFNGQAVYFSINCVSDDQFGFAVDDFKVTAQVLSTETFAKNNFTVSPNPATDVLNISNVNNLEITNATITDVNGRIVKQINTSFQSINVSELSSGIYFLKLATTEGEGVTKFVKN